MAAEGAGGGELAQLMTDHILSDIDGNVLLSVVNGDGVTDHIGEDRGCSGPCLDDGLLTGLIHFLDPGKKPFGHERSLFD